MASLITLERRRPLAVGSKVIAFGRSTRVKTLPVFDELYVVSDMHMGGRRDDAGNFQIFNQGPRLGRFIDYITARRPDGQVGLVLNGDVFDSLAEDGAGYIALDADSAIGI